MWNSPSGGWQSSSTLSSPLRALSLTTFWTMKQRGGLHGQKNYRSLHWIQKCHCRWVLNISLSLYLTCIIFHAGCPSSHSWDCVFPLLHWPPDGQPSTSDAGGKCWQWEDCAHQQQADLSWWRWDTGHYHTTKLLHKLTYAATGKHTFSAWDLTTDRGGYTGISFPCPLKCTHEATSVSERSLNCFTANGKH